MAKLALRWTSVNEKSLTSYSRTHKPPSGPTTRFFRTSQHTNRARRLLIVKGKVLPHPLSLLIAIDVLRLVYTRTVTATTSWCWASKFWVANEHPGESRYPTCRGSKLTAENGWWSTILWRGRVLALLVRLSTEWKCFCFMLACCL